MMTIGNRLHLRGVLKQFSVQWPSRLADVHAIDVGDLTDLLRATPIDWAHAPAINVPGAAPVGGALDAWFTSHGRQLTSRFENMLRRDMDETNEEIKEKRALPKVERDACMAPPNWGRFLDQVTNFEDFAAAKAEMDGPGPVQLKLTSQSMRSKMM